MNDPQVPPPVQQPVLRDEIIADALMNPGERKAIGLSDGDNGPLPVVIELNLQHASALAGSTNRLEAWTAGGFPARR